jgi:hypothetical protein
MSGVSNIKMGLVKKVGINHKTSHDPRSTGGILKLLLPIYATWGLDGVFVRVSNRLISFSSLSMPEDRADVAKPRTPCLSKRYVRRFFFSSASPSNKVKRWVSSRRTSCAAMIDAAADSRTIKDDVSFSDYHHTSIMGIDPMVRNAPRLKSLSDVAVLPPQFPRANVE